MDQFQRAHIPDSETVALQYAIVDTILRSLPETATPAERALARCHAWDQANQTIITETEGTVWRNSTYQVRKIPVPQPKGWPCAMVWLSIKRNDREPVHDWRDLQEIKNQLVGPNHEAVELYPAEARVTDTANQYHLWVMADPDVWFPFGFTERHKTDVSLHKSKQRPFTKEATHAGTTETAAMVPTSTDGGTQEHPGPAAG